MSSAEKLEKSAKRLRLASWLFGVALLAALAFAGWAVVVNNQQAAQITKIESPCLRYGAKSAQCKESFEQAVLTITHAEACAILRKAGLEITQCAHARLRQERTRHDERVEANAPSVTDQSSGGDASQPADHAGQQPKPGKPGGRHKGGHQGAKSPPPTTREPSPSPQPEPSSPPASESAVPSPRPGNSDETPAAEHSQGVTACVDLVVSACVKAGP